MNFILAPWHIAFAALLPVHNLLRKCSAESAGRNVKRERELRFEVPYGVGLIARNPIRKSDEVVYRSWSTESGWLTADPVGKLHRLCGPAMCSSLKELPQRESAAEIGAPAVYQKF